MSKDPKAIVQEMVKLVGKRRTKKLLVDEDVSLTLAANLLEIAIIRNSLISSPVVCELNH